MSEEMFGESKARQAELVENYVAVMYAETEGEAEYFRSLLDRHGIPAMIEGAEERLRPSAGISVLVPSVRLDEASDLVVSNDVGDVDDSEDEVKDGTPDDDDEFDDFDDDDDDVDDDDDDDDAFDDDDDEAEEDF